MEEKKKIPRNQNRQEHTAQERVKRILEIWTEVSKPSQICREMGINWQQLHNWESRAMEAMLKALEPRQRQKMEPVIGSRVMNLLSRKSLSKAEKTQLRLTKRPGTIQKDKTENAPVTPC